jgi:hypothetical protein
VAPTTATLKPMRTLQKAARCDAHARGGRRVIMGIGGYFNGMLRGYARLQGS